MKKSVSLTKIILGLVLAVIVVFTANSNQVIYKSTYAEGEQSQQMASAKGGYDWEDRKKISEISDNDVFSYTNNQTGFEGNKIDIRDYDSMNESYKVASGVIKYIPKDLFLHVGKYKFVGEEYGFYVETKYAEIGDGISVYEEHTYSTVNVFDVIDNVDNFGNITISVEPIWQNFFFAGKNELVKRCIRPDEEAIYLSDFCISLGVKNTNAVSESEGDYIMYSEINYSGFTLSNDPSGLIETTVQFAVCKGANILIPRLGTAIEYIWNSVKYAEDLNNAFTMTKNKITAGAKDFVVNYGNSIEEQKFNNGGCLIKEATVGSHSRGTERPLKQ